MAAAVSAKYNLLLDVTETLGLGVDMATDPAVKHVFPTVISGTLTSSSSVPVTKTYNDTLALSAGTLDVDLTALPGPSGTTVTFDGLKVQLIKIRNNSTTDTLTIAGASVNPYELFGAADGQITLPVGGTCEFFMNEGLADVSATVKDVTFTSSDNTAPFDIQLVAG